MNPTILFYTAILSSTGGAQYTMSLLAPELAKRGYDIRFFTRPPHDPGHRYSRLLTQAGIPVYTLQRLDQNRLVAFIGQIVCILFVLPYSLFRWRSLSDSWHSVKSIFSTFIAKLEKRQIRNHFTKTLQTAKNNGKDVILHVWGPAMLTPLLLEWAEEHQTPSIYHEMGEADEQYIKMFSMEGTVESINRADMVICVSPSVSEKMHRVFGYKGRIESIYDVIVDPAEKWVRGRKTNGRVTFGAIGRLVAHKRHSDLIHAIKSLSDDGYDTGLVIASDGPMRKPLEQLSQELGIKDRVKFLGEFENLEEVMAEFDIFTLTSSSESQCMPVTESMAYGKPVVASDFGGIPDFVQDGITGFLVPVGDQSKLVASMKKLLDNPDLREEMGRRGRERFLAHFTPEKVVDSIETVYASLLNSNQN